MTKRRRPPPRRWPLSLPVIAGVVAGGLWLGSWWSAPHDPPRAPMTAASANDNVPHGRPISPPPKRTAAASPTKRARPAKPPTPAASAPTRPTPAAPPAPRPSPRPTLTSTLSPTAKLHALLDSVRQEHGAPRLARYPGMDATAQEWADHMATTDVLAHRPTVAPYRGEIIASGADTASAAVSLWMASPAHNKIMLDPAYRMAGIGYNSGYWIVVFS